MAGQQTIHRARRMSGMKPALLGIALGAAVAGCGDVTAAGVEFRVEGTATTLTGTPAVGAVMTGELYIGDCATGEMRQRSQVLSDGNGRFSVPFGVEFSGCIRLMGTGSQGSGVVEKSGVQAGGSGLKVVPMDITLGAL